jgi:ABC-type sugar transport system ATPase subunit
MGLLVVWGFGIWQVAHGDITVGMLLAAIAYIGRFYGRLDSMSRIVSVTQKSASAAKRIFDILDHVSSVPEPQNPVQVDRVQGRIELRDVGFRYGNRAVNRGINLQIAPGEMIGLVGHSGSGKSTLVNLICRFYDVSEGAILVDGVDIRSYAVADFRRNIGLVLQEPFLFFGTIAENIAYGLPDASRAQIVAAEGRRRAPIKSGQLAQKIEGKASARVTDKFGAGRTMIGGVVVAGTPYGKSVSFGRYYPFGEYTIRRSKSAPAFVGFRYSSFRSGNKNPYLKQAREASKPNVVALWNVLLRRYIQINGYEYTQTS